MNIKPDKIQSVSAELINYDIWPNSLSRDELIQYIERLDLSSEDKDEVMYIVEYVTNTVYSKRDYAKRKPFYEEVLGL
jgi:hypothetical protein